LTLRHAPRLAGKKTLAHGSRDIILSACHGYIGWARLKRKDLTAGLESLKRAIDLYPYGLPTLRLYFDTLLQLSAQVGTLTPALAADLADAFVAVINVNPSILLTHVYTVVPILADNGEHRTARAVLAAWHQLANVVHRLRQDDERHQINLVAILWNYRSLLP